MKTLDEKCLKSLKIISSCKYPAYPAAQFIAVRLTEFMCAADFAVLDICSWVSPGRNKHKGVGMTFEQTSAGERANVDQIPCYEAKKLRSLRINIVNADCTNKKVLPTSHLYENQPLPVTQLSQLRIQQLR